MELNVNEPLMTCRNIAKSRTKLLIVCHWQDIAVTGGCLLVTGSPAWRWQEHYTGDYTKRERLSLRCAKSLTCKCNSRYSKGNRSVMKWRTESQQRRSFCNGNGTKASAHSFVLRKTTGSNSWMIKLSSMMCEILFTLNEKSRVR